MTEDWDEPIFAEGGSLEDAPIFGDDSSNLDLSGYTLPQLISLRDRINGMLPASRLADINLEQELILQFFAVKHILQDIREDDTIPANQKAQLLNTCSAIIRQMTESQKSLYSSERAKRLERVLVQTLREADTHLAEKFVAALELALEDV